MAEFDIARTRKTLFGALLDARDTFGRNKAALEDLERQPITFGRLVLGSLVLGRKLAGLTKEREICRRAAAERAGHRGHPVRAQRLRARAGLPELHRRASRTSRRPASWPGSSTIVTSRRFVEQGKLDDVVEALGRGAADPVARGCARRPDELRQAARAVSIPGSRGASTPGRGSSPTIRPCCSSRRDPRACRRAWCCRTPISSPTPIR